ncbi:hypothetical protein YT03_003512 [Salmonella enterica subsp. enterica]|uniref:hypothetical protein n=1 Tax=Salmonella enterica TaxID=28901 RepID=UPI0009AD74A8|nr:hypothetical protein [Salmonella enterica]EDU9607383.1 hypothetical protein [Salmonella enterica subsp. enterica serovar Sandiego]
MNLHLRQYGVGIASLLFLYWSLSFVNAYFLNEHPLSAEAWQKMRLQVLLVTVSLVITTGRLFVLDTSDRREAMPLVLLTMLTLHALALLAPSGWLFYQWQWDGRCLLQWQGIAFSFSLLILPAVVFLFFS